MSIILGILTAFGAYHLWTAIGGWRRARDQDAEPRDVGSDSGGIARHAPKPVTFLVTAYGEPETVVPCVDSILESEYPEDTLRVLVVVDEDGEGTVDAVQDRLEREGATSTRTREGDELLRTERVTAVLRRGERAGRGKPQALQDSLRHLPEEGLIGILDADHVLDRDFIARALPRFDDPEVGIVQGRRRPKHQPASWVARWDVLEQNVGQVQTLLTRDKVGCASFYGSTALIRAELLHAIGWHDCLSEDTRLHYELRDRGYRVAYEPRAGSREEHVTRLRHYVPQRRRWAAGHTQVMASKMGDLVASRLPLVQRLDAAFHLTYYNMALLLVAYWLLRSVDYWIHGTSAMLDPVLGAAAFGAALTGTWEWLQRKRLDETVNGVIAGGILSFVLATLVASYLVPHPAVGRFPLALEVALFVTPLLEMALGYLNPVLRDGHAETATRLDHVKNWLVLVFAAPIMLVVNLYATLTGALVSLRGGRTPWVKTVRSKISGRRDATG